MLAKKLEAAVAGQATGTATYVEDVFSTYLYAGNGSSQVIENGIRLGDSNAGGSVYFDGSGDSLSLANSSSFAFGTGDFTIEFWVNWTYTQYNAVISNSTTSQDSGSWIVGYNNTANYFGFCYDVPGFNFITADFSSYHNTWTHVAVTRSGTDLRLYFNGTSVANTTNSTNFSYSSNNVKIGQRWSNQDAYTTTGYLSNLRVVKGTAVYTGASFTPPTSALTAISGTSLLTCQGDTPFTDNSTNGFTITQNGNVAAKSFGPFTSDVAGEGGLVWIKQRSASNDHQLYDTARGNSYKLVTNDTSAQGDTSPNGLTAFNSNGFSLGSYSTSNTNAATYASWTFRKAPKFFDVVTWTGNGANPRAISHSLGSAPGCIIIKNTSSVSDWYVYHRSLATSYYLKLNTTDAQINNTTGKPWNTTPTDTEFYVGGSSGQNITDETYVAYLFAHDAGGFGDAGDQSVIKCGSFTTDGSGNATVDLGWEPQWFMYKASSTTGNWIISDNMRGWTAGQSTNFIRANTSDAEGSQGIHGPTATGTIGTGNFLTSTTYIYIAIRRGPMKTPTDGTSVFAPVTRSAISTTITTNTNPDLLATFPRNSAVTASSWLDKLRGKIAYLASSLTDAEYAGATAALTDWGNTGVTYNSSAGGPTNDSGVTYVDYYFTRSPKFFDVVCYKGNGSASGQVVPHNLGVAPEFIIVKKRNAARNWIVYHSGLTSEDYYLYFTDAIEALNAAKWGTVPTSTNFYLGGNSSDNNSASDDFVAYLFASCPGVSKVGSYVGTGVSGLQIDCGFSNGARFVLIKRATGSVNDWFVCDTARGIVASSEKYSKLNVTNSEATLDYVDPYSAGFEIGSTAGAVNASGSTYIYLAIA